MIVDDYQEKQRLEKENESSVVHSIAKVGSVSSSGLTLIFPGQSLATGKRYKYNKSVTFNAGDTVYIVKVSGTYIVVCKI